VIVWDVGTGERVRTLTGHTGPVWSVAFSPDGRLLASGSEDQTVILWDVRTGERVRTLDGAYGRVWSVAFSPDGRLLASGSEGPDGDPMGCAHRGAGADPNGAYGTVERVFQRGLFPGWAVAGLGVWGLTRR
jgi:hypothetical protein